MLSDGERRTQMRSGRLAVHHINYISSEIMKINDVQRCLPMRPDPTLISVLRDTPHPDSGGSGSIHRHLASSRCLNSDDVRRSLVTFIEVERMYWQVEIIYGRYTSLILGELIPVDNTRAWPIQEG